jgi:hypothetical protein
MSNKGNPDLAQCTCGHTLEEHADTFCAPCEVEECDCCSFDEDYDAD